MLEKLHYLHLTNVLNKIHIFKTMMAFLDCLITDFIVPEQEESPEFYRFRPSCTKFLCRKPVGTFYEDLKLGLQCS